MPRRKPAPPPPPPPKRVPGRPPELDTIVGTDPRDQSPITVGTRIVGLVRSGMYVEAAAAASGVTKATVYTWLRMGARAESRVMAAWALVQGTDAEPLIDLTEHEMNCIEFANAFYEAETSWEASQLLTLESIARGGLTTTKVVERRDAQGATLEVVTTTETLPPNLQAIIWRLSRRFPSRYGAKVTVERGQAERTTPTEEEQSQDLARELAAWNQAAGRE